MNPLLARLLELAELLTAAPGVSSDDLRALRAAVAAVVIQDNLALAQVDTTGQEQWVVDAIREGLEYATRLQHKDTRLRIEREELPPATVFEPPAVRPTKTLGPFVDRAGGLLRILLLESAPFVEVHFGPPLLGVEPAWLLLPPDPTTGDNGSTWQLPPGTVWIRASHLVAAATGYTGLRISGGELTLDTAAPLQRGRIIVAPFSGWSLTLTPEPGTAPTELQIRKDAGARISGPVQIEGLGSTLTLTAIAVAPRVENGRIAFPLDPGADPSWTFVSQSPVMQLQGETRVDAAAYALPLTTLEPGALGGARDGGSMVCLLSGQLTGSLTGQTGDKFRSLAAQFTASASSLEFDCRQITAAGRYDIALWPTAQSQCVFAQTPISRLMFRSERDGFESAAIFGGQVRNRWDLPCRADNKPFPFEGTIAIFGLLSDSTGLRVLCAASTEPPNEPASLVLENVLFRVRAPRRVSLNTFNKSGAATLLLDAAWAAPTLPDPFAWNLTHTDFGGLVEDAVRVRLDWQDRAAPVVTSTLEKPVTFPPFEMPASADPDERILRTRFNGHLQARDGSFCLFDLSSNDDYRGLALESPAEPAPALRDNRLNVPLRQVRLLLQPQVQWEPVLDVPTGQIRSSTMNGGPALVGVNSVKLVPTLPAMITRELPAATQLKQPAAALFSLPFGLRAMVQLSPPQEFLGAAVAPRSVTTSLHRPAFDDHRAAQQIRISANDSPEPSRVMPGALRQLANLVNPPGTSVLPALMRTRLNQDFANSVPLHQADLSGYGLSCFSHWIQVLDDTGFIKAHFDVVNGRTSYEVIQFQSIKWPSQSRMVRTIVLERHNSGLVFRTDSGWESVTPGTFDRWIPFEKGVVKGYYNIRRVRIVGSEDGITLGPSTQAGFQVQVQQVLFDADAEIEDLTAGGAGARVPVYDQTGYIQINPPKAFSPADLRLLFQKVGPIGGPADCGVRVNKTLAMQLSGLLADHAPDDVGNPGFAIAAYGSPKLPRAGRWSAVKMDPALREPSPVDPHRGVPISRMGAGPYRMRDASDIRRTNPRTMYGLLMSNETSRALFPQPRLEPAQQGRILTDAPIVADPYSLSQASGQMPRPTFGLQAQQAPGFDIDAADQWRITNSNFTFTPPAQNLLKGAEWGIGRVYNGNDLKLDIDSLNAVPWGVDVVPASLDIDIPPFGKVMSIVSTYAAQSGGIPKLDKPDLLFSGALEELKKTLDSLQHLVKLPFHVNVTVAAAGRTQPVLHRSHRPPLPHRRRPQRTHRRRPREVLWRVPDSRRAGGGPHRREARPPVGAVHGRLAAGHPAAAALRRRYVPLRGRNPRDRTASRGAHLLRGRLAGRRSRQGTDRGRSDRKIRLLAGPADVAAGRLSRHGSPGETARRTVRLLVLHRGDGSSRAGDAANRPDSLPHSRRGDRAGRLLHRGGQGLRNRVRTEHSPGGGGAHRRSESARRRRVALGDFDGSRRRASQHTDVRPIVGWGFPRGSLPRLA